MGSRVVPLAGRRVVVVGGGFLGTRIALGALARGLRTTVLSRRAAVDPALVAAGARIVIGDAADSDVVADLLVRPAHVVHCAGGRLPTASVDDPVGDAIGTFSAVLGVLEAMRRRAGSRLTYLSSGGTVYGRPTTEPVDEDHPCHPVVPYGVSRLGAEAYVRAYAGLHGVPALVLRLGNVYGPTQPSQRRQGIVATLLAAAHDGGVVEIWGDGAVARDYVHVDDVVEVVHRLAATPMALATLNVGTGVARTVLEVVAAVEDVSGTRLRIEVLPGRPYDVARIALSPRRLAALIPFAPLSLEEGVRRCWDAQMLEVGEGVAAGRA